MTQKKSDTWQIFERNTCSQLNLNLFDAKNESEFNKMRDFLSDRKNDWLAHVEKIGYLDEADYFKGLGESVNTPIWPYGPLGLYRGNDGNRKTWGYNLAMTDTGLGSVGFSNTAGANWFISQNRSNGEPNGNYNANCWLRFIYAEDGTVKRLEGYFEVL